MHANRVWLLLILIIGASALFFGLKTSYKLYLYYTETTYTIALSTKWSLEELSRTRYIPTAHYTYSVNDTLYSGETELSSQVYRNRWSAEEDLATYPGRTWRVWYNPHHPTYSTLQKRFPIKESFSTALLIAILGYLIWLGFYVDRTSA